MTDKELLLLDKFAGLALAGYTRGGLSYSEREDECKEVASACYCLASFMLRERRAILKRISTHEDNR